MLVNNSVRLGVRVREDCRVAIDETSPEQRLYDAACRWSSAPGYESKDLIDGAVRALVDGLDSPALRQLAGASASDRSDEIQSLLDDTLDQLRIPRPGGIDPWKRVMSGGRIFSRLPKESIRFEVAPAGKEVSGHQLLVYVDGVEMTSKGAGMGMDPFDVLIPENRLEATTTTQRVPIARCECGEYGCGVTDVNIIRDGDVVHWDWLQEVPMRHGVTFNAEQYDAEVARVAADHGWERPQDTTARLVIEGADDASLADRGLRISWAAADYRDPSLFVVSFMTTDNNFQVFIRVPSEGREPGVVADDVLGLLNKQPSKWPATFHALQPKVTARPSMAGWRWKREQIGIR